MNPDDYKVLAKTQRARILGERLMALEERHFRLYLDMEDAGELGNTEVAARSAEQISITEKQIARAVLMLDALPEGKQVLEEMRST